jgi:putative transposase
MAEHSGKYRKLSHVVYQCTYHIVFVPKYRFRVLTGAIKTLLEEDIAMLCSWKEVEILELSVQPDHVHLVCSIPPKVSVSQFMGLLKGKLAIKLFKSYPRLKQKPYWGNHFGAQGLLCEHSRHGGGVNPSLCAVSGGSGEAAGTGRPQFRPVFLSAPFRGETERNPRPLGVVV